ncbi:carbamoyltransferase HypF [Devriesea agamarum]|uniref:carbamoyltransferase HypF n=1 Tax=Devriesea agamarum TaxID=472569 RepID=UPI00071C68BF|nr:carbamoyltransferase HypF [Devriesea agamarum]
MTAANDTVNLVRVSSTLTGVVQGVGFRPHVARMSERFAVTGWCGNDDVSVFLEAQGPPAQVQAFLTAVVDQAPPLARVIGKEQRSIDPVPDENGFTIVPSRHRPGARSLIPPDVALCEDCARELANPEDRRYAYPFITCTNCGPRLSIIEDLPYDRPATTMRDFPLCSACHREYQDVTDRRFHAQPIGCFECGPHLWIVSSQEIPKLDPFAMMRQSVQPGHAQQEGAVIPSDFLDGRGTPRDRASQLSVLNDARQRLRRGEILAVKGIGGFHLMCDARNQEAVARLRQRKHRPDKPFAVMVKDLATARELAVLDPDAERLLTSPARPIVIVPAREAWAEDSQDRRHTSSRRPLAAQIAPGTSEIGILLPYAPIHMLLFGSNAADDISTTPMPDVLVATSGNLSDEPLAWTNRDALTNLCHIADAFVLNNRDIAVPVEDSVFRGTVPSRRSRGYAPLPLPLPQPTPSVVLGVGGEMKNAFTLLHHNLAFSSPHLGDMGSLASSRAHAAAVHAMLHMHRTVPDVLVHDQHPGYATTRFAQHYADEHPQVRVLAVQHHHAHAVSLLAEHGLLGHSAVVAAIDGTGYGSDGTIWGGEILAIDPDVITATRLGHLPAFPLMGGDSAVKRPWISALGLVHALSLRSRQYRLFPEVPPTARETVQAQIDRGQAVMTTSLGRTLDGFAAILGLCQEQTFEAQAPTLLEQAAARARPRTFHSAADRPRHDTGPRHKLRAQYQRIIERACQGEDPCELAWQLHVVIAEALADALIRAAEHTGARILGLSGGAALNNILTEIIRDRIGQAGHTLLIHKAVPANDGGLGLGQAALGAYAMTSTYTTIPVVCRADSLPNGEL